MHLCECRRARCIAIRRRNLIPRRSLSDENEGHGTGARSPLGEMESDVSGGDVIGGFGDLRWCWWLLFYFVVLQFDCVRLLWGLLRGCWVAARRLLGGGWEAARRLLEDCWEAGRLLLGGC